MWFQGCLYFFSYLLFIPSKQTFQTIISNASIQSDLNVYFTWNKKQEQEQEQEEEDEEEEEEQQQH